MPERIQLSRRSGWRIPPNTKSVARPGKWGNPFTVEEFGRWGAVDKYRTWVKGRICDGHLNLAELRGKNLACWCPFFDEHGEPVLCHANVLLELANGVGGGGDDREHG